jgi:hypothetical protein
MNALLDYYEVLQVSPKADQEVIQVAYRRLAIKWHPDRNPGDSFAFERMRLLNEAYAVLFDMQRRREYDLLRNSPTPSGGVNEEPERVTVTPNQNAEPPSRTSPTTEVKPDIAIRHDPASGVVSLFFGLFSSCCAIVFFITWISHGSKLGVEVLVAMLFFVGMGIWLTRVGINRMTDRSAKLSFTGIGLTDHRTGVHIKWIDVCGVRLFIQTTTGHLSSALMFVKVPQRDGFGEIAFDVMDLEKPFRQIAELVRQRAIVAQADITNM